MADQQQKLHPEPTWAIVAMGLLTSGAIPDFDPNNQASLQKLVTATASVHAALYPQLAETGSPVTPDGKPKPSRVSVGARWVEQYFRCRSIRRHVPAPSAFRHCRSQTEQTQRRIAVS